jgi:eukaryotic-like serine/threonine-protein kinase
MTLAVGTRLGAYEIVSAIGAGGMGEVYRARDTKLGREVAVKVLPDHFARDPHRLARFEREARALASLNHPGAAAIYGLEQAGEIHFIVMELVPGRTLEERLAGGALPLSEALRLGRQIAAALEAAHGQGIVHRDLKPANVKVTPEGRVKVLDFGLAKMLASGSAPGSSEAQTATADGTREGTVLGTPAYMSPEQARGKSVDKRTDIWSFGCVLYEMVAGRKPFVGETVSDTVVAILSREPDWSALPQATPAALRQLLHRCLEKDVERRQRDAGDVAIEIDDTLQALEPAPRAGRGWLLAAVVTGAALVVLLALAVGRFRRAPAGPLQPSLSQVTFREGVEDFPAWSPDGQHLLFAEEVGRVRKIFVKELVGGEDKQLTHGDADDIQPSWAPNGKTILFVRARQAGRKLEPGDIFGIYDGGDVWALDLGSGKESLFLENAFNPAHSPDGSRIAVDASWVGPRRLWIVDAEGRNPQQATSDVSEAVMHLRPRWSPDGARLVFQNVERTKFDVRVVDLTSRKLTWVTSDTPHDVGPVWSRSGRYLYFSSDRSGGWNVWRVPVAADGSPAGPLQQLTTGAGQDVGLALSPDGLRLAFSVLKQNADIWRLPVSPADGKPAGRPEPVIATTREDSRGAWSPDGATIAFNSDRSGDMNIWVYALKDGSTRQLTRGAGGDFQPNWSPDGKTIVFFSSRAGSADIWRVDVASGALTRLSGGDEVDTNPFFSPDGTRIAYQSDRGGHLEVWVMSADGSGARPLTRAGVTGHFMRWTQDGGGIVFRCPCGGKPQTLRVGLDGAEPQPVGEVAGGSHSSFSPDFSLIMDVVGHKTLWVSPLRSGKPGPVFEFEDADSRIDYPVWSPDGRFVLFDRFQPQGGDIWMMERFESALQ